MSLIPDRYSNWRRADSLPGLLLAEFPFPLRPLLSERRLSNVNWYNNSGRRMNDRSLHRKNSPRIYLLFIYLHRSSGGTLPFSVNEIVDRSMNR